ncbi:MAG: hypothetical protein J0H81_00275 [Sphingopyxis terrae]|nr:hypothetical protein [Sphingopyxis terrae]
MIKTPLSNRRSTRIRLLSGAGLSPIERQMGRAMRAPDEHAGDGGDTGTGAAAEGAAGADGAGTSALGAAAADSAGADSGASGDGDAGAGDGAAAEGKEDADGAGGAAAGAAGKAADGKEDDDKGDAGDVSIVGAPEDYDTAAFTMPEGVEFDAEMFDLVKDDLKGMDLSQKGAEAVVGIFASKVAPKIEERAVKAIDDAGAQLRANLARDLQADPEVGGTKLKESQAYAAKAFAHFVPKAEERAQLSQFLNESGLGDHPLLTRVIAGAGRALSEASVPGAAGGAQERSAAEKFYGRKG